MNEDSAVAVEIEDVPEDLPDETPEDAPEAEEASAEERRGGHGPGFLAGLLIGLALGAIVVLLTQPSEGELAEGGGLLGTLRSRFQEASKEAHEAAQEKEAELRARYEELTR